MASPALVLLPRNPSTLLTRECSHDSVGMGGHRVVGYPWPVCIQRLEQAMPGDKKIPRETRLALDRRASATGRRNAAELSAKYRMQPPAEIIKAAEAAFEHTARRVLREGRIEGNHEALLNHLVEIWNLSFAVELRRQRRRREKGLS